MERGYKFDNDLARSRELLSKLFDWFLLEPCTCENLVLQLIRRILQVNYEIFKGIKCFTMKLLQSECGKLLQKHYGNTAIKCELEKIKTYIEPQYQSYIDDLLQDLNAIEVPPLISNVPLSYRSDDTYKNICDSTATPIEGNITQNPSPEQLTGFASQILFKKQISRIVLLVSTKTRRKILNIFLNCVH